MSLSGKSDNDPSKKASLEKARQNGFGQKGVAGRKKLDATAKFEERAESKMDKLIDKTFDAWERGLSSNNTKLAVDTANKFTRIYYNPDQKVVVEGGPDNRQVHLNILMQQSDLNPKEKALLEKFGNILADGAKNQPKEEDIVEAEVIDEE